MNDKIGRNELCPCGSGKKHKKCCLVMHASTVEEVDFEWHHLRKLEGTIVDKHLLSYVSKELPKEVMLTAISDLIPENLPQELDRDIYFHNFFLPLFLFEWLPAEDEFQLANFDSGCTIAVNYLKTHGNRLNNRERRFIETMNKTYYSFYSILDVEYEKSLTVKDILRETTHYIKERQGTHHLKRGDIVFSRILTIDQSSIFIGMAPFGIPAQYHTELIDLRKCLSEEIKEEGLSAESLRNDFNLEVLGCFFNIMDEAFERPAPKLTNTDGDAFQFCTSYFELFSGIEESFQQLLALTLSRDPAPFLMEATRNKLGKIESLRFPWAKKGNKKNVDWDTTVLGEITLEPGKLTLETNSEKRAKKGQKLLEKHLGNAIAFQKLLVEAPEEKIKSAPALSKESQQEQSELMASPEIQAQIKNMAEAHWRSWFDQPIPALDDQTPRQAAKTKDGREKLEALLLQYERYDMDRNAGDPFKADMHYLRAELAMDKD
jgi:hypothetical protein